LSSLSIVVPARNEEGNLKDCIQTILGALDGVITEYEIVIVDDGSTDSTGMLADTLAFEIPGVRVVHNASGSGFAQAYRRGLGLASKEYVGLIPGDNEIQPVSMRAIFRAVGPAVGTAAIVVPFTANQADRPWLRRVLSRTFTGTVNTLFGLRLHYFQGPSVYPTALARRIPTTTRGYAFLTEMLVRALAAGHRAVEVPMYIQPRQFGASRAVTVRNVVTSLKTVLLVLWDVRIRRKPLR
jgi:glycosyltransferase involved in cell wall biosynthesis